MKKPHYIEIESEIRRAISILKMRDSDHSKAVWEFAIDKQGLEIGSETVRGDSPSLVQRARHRVPGVWVVG